MSDSEDFLLKIDAEDLFPETTACGLKRKARTESKKEKKKRKKMKIGKLVPTHFIAFQIYNAAIRERIVEMQKKITEKNPLLDQALIDPRTLHVTLAVTRLENEERIRQLQERLQDWGENQMKDHFGEPIHLTFKGIGTFRKDVAFVKINECENYKRLCNLSTAMNDLLSSSGFYSDNKRGFTPHLTLLKLSKNYKLFKSKKELAGDIETLNECQDEFGSQNVEDIQLLSMLDKKDVNGYYKCLWQRRTGNSDQEEKPNILE